MTGSIVLAFAFAALSANALGVHETPAPSPKYIPPVCQGRPITAVPRTVALAQTRRVQIIVRKGA